MPLKTKTSIVVDELLKVLLLSSAGAITVAAPNALTALEKPILKIAKRLDKDLDGRKIAYYTKRLAVVDVHQIDEDHFEVKVTDKGEKRGIKASFDNLEIPKPKVWDKRWRLVVFDIPEEYRNSRVFLTEKLKSLSFYMMQRSLWVHPFPCLEQVALIKHILPEVAPYVVLLETDNIDQHDRLLQHFVKILPL